jgi:hypothetical protein
MKGGRIGSPKVGNSTLFVYGDNDGFLHLNIKRFEYNVNFFGNIFDEIIYSKNYVQHN